MGLNNCRVCSDGPLWEDHGTEQLRENHGLVQFDQLPETSWAGFWAPGASWAGFLSMSMSLGWIPLCWILGSWGLRTEKVS